MILDSTFTAMAKETAEKMFDSGDVIWMFQDSPQIVAGRIRSAFHAVAALQREQDAISVEACLAVPPHWRAILAAAIRATPETPTQAKPYAATLSCGDRFHVSVVGASHCNCGKIKLRTPETPKPAV